MRIRIGNKLVEAELINGKPVVKARAEEIRHPDGRVDTVIHVPCLKIQPKTQK